MLALGCCLPYQGAACSTVLILGPDVLLNGISAENLQLQHGYNSPWWIHIYLALGLF